IAHAKPDRPATDLGGAIAHGLESNPHPLAVIALTDGVANQSDNNNAALGALIDGGTPFIGVGVGRDTEVTSISVRNVSAPESAPPKQNFRITAQLQAITSSETPAFELLLLRDGQLAQSRKVAPSHGSRLWTENFTVTEPEDGTHIYTVQLQLPRPAGANAADALTCLKKEESAQVRITGENEMRVLFVQGKLTWDFKFIGRALAEDPSVKVTGLSRTSVKSVFRQNVLTPGELTSGFPTTMEEIAPFRLVVLSSINPTGLSQPQQELVARFCSELGGGVLLLGGPDTFDASWSGSKLEKLLPVTFDPTPALTGVDQPFHMQITDEALQNPAFQIADQAANRAAWAQLPTFSEYGRVASAKPGAVVWARHEEDSNSSGKRILMASQRYGAGLSAVICIDNFWRWRLAKDANIQQFDRFWQQLFRYLGQAGRQDVTLNFTDEDLRLGSDIHMAVERQPDSTTVTQADPKPAEYRVVVHDPGGAAVFDQKCELVPSRPVDVAFHSEKEGVYMASVQDPNGAELASRSIDIRSTDLELEKTARDMENLRQWASLSGGTALRLEDCADGEGIVSAIKAAIAKSESPRKTVAPAGLNPWVLSLLLISLGAEWILRRKWGLP
ncbi:MAG TPA: hypothetical protein VG733_08285, partial [Chthoniobacteraceae bacterium]|nr:hypothetical protein [Chthoniobacteraceae bacterium]